MRIVIKVGTQVIAGKNGLDQKKIANLVREISLLLKRGVEVVLVTSGAIGAGLPEIPFTNPHRKKIAAAIGQPLLIHSYIREAKKYKIPIGQILILSDDLNNKERFKNFVSNVGIMLSHKVLPIINENDVMKTEDLTIGDNDILGAKIAVGLKAKKLLILTNQNGLHTCNPDHHKNAKLIKKVVNINLEIENLCSPAKSDLGLGGMPSKIQAAKYATVRGVETFIGNGNKKGIIVSVLNKNFPGTRFRPKI
ncbi:MAG: Glutamate 5-kinase [Parcubacteria group bacterium GW2011_GWF2_38_8]|nr:MAG: Glutamate 5-kinase [Parcubacteria group bacterium GW2011_GWF2_38_8]